jgi:hypothetical protein
MDCNKECEKGRHNLEHRGVMLYFLRHMLDEATFNKWVILNWETKGISLHTYWGLGSKYLCLLFNLDVSACNVLQCATWNIGVSLAYVHSWRFYFNLDDISQAHYPLWPKFPRLCYRTIFTLIEEKVKGEQIGVTGDYPITVTSIGCLFLFRVVGPGETSLVTWGFEKAKGK